MVKEKVDENRWNFPDGWADIGYTPFESTEKEVFEETGQAAIAMRLLVVFDKGLHPHPHNPGTYTTLTSCVKYRGAGYWWTPLRRAMPLGSTLNYWLVYLPQPIA